MSDTVLDLSILDEKSRMNLIRSAKESGWIVAHEPKPKVHPDRKMSRFYYRFTVSDAWDRSRENRLNSVP